MIRPRTTARPNAGAALQMRGAFNRSPARPSGHAAAAPPSVARNFRRSFPCDPPVGGHSCNGGMIPRFDRAVLEQTRGVEWQENGSLTIVVRPNRDLRGSNEAATSLLPQHQG